MARADEHLVKVYLRDQLIKTHPRRQPSSRHRCRGHAADHPSPDFLFIPFLSPAGKEKERPLS